MSTTGELTGLQTESRNPKSTGIDNVSTLELCQIINDEDRTVADLVKGCLPVIARTIDALAPRVREGGRVVYVGAGTSGRLGVLDASEIPPTYSAPPSQFVGLIAGGDVALRSAKEGAEDSLEAAVEDLAPLNLDGEKDSLIGIASSGRTPYVLSSIAFAKARGCLTVGIACSAPSAMSESGHIDHMIDVVTGPEVVTGSTRMKAGTATKLVLNMLSTGVMIKIGKTFGNIMVDVKPTNKKLELRARRTLREICGDRCPASDEALDKELNVCDRNVKLTAVKISLGVPIVEAENRLRDAGGVLATVLKTPQTSNRLMNRTNSRRRYVLCVDGGGSKCSAVIMSEDGMVGHGESGPCNPSDIGTHGAVCAIQTAVKKALESFDLSPPRTLQELCIVDMWIGLAGGDREPIAGSIGSAVTALFGRQMKLKITNDIELLATAASHELESDDVTVLIAGTGSIAVRYRREQDGLRRVRRAGGWGALLGDDGSGFDIGRKAVRFALQRLEQETLCSSSDKEEVDPLVNVICEYFRPARSEVSDVELLNGVLLSASGAEQSTSELKQRIASCAKAVIVASKISSRARTITSDAVDSLLSLITSVQNQTGTAANMPSLVLVGGLFNSRSIKEALIARMEKSRLGLRSIKHVDNPALAGARFLARQL